ERVQPRGHQPAEGGLRRQRRIEMKILRIELAREGDDVRLGDGHALGLEALTDGEILKEKVARGSHALPYRHGEGTVARSADPRLRRNLPGRSLRRSSPGSRLCQRLSACWLRRCLPSRLCGPLAVHGGPVRVGIAGLNGHLRYRPTYDAAHLRLWL